MSSVRRPAPPAIDIIERAIFLLRSRPAAVWAVQAAGAVPLLLSALYFVFDMTSDGADESRPAAEALVCAACFLWFNACRARFAQLLLSGLSDAHPESWKRALDPVNLALQSCKLFVMPLALVAIIPLGWTVAFFRTSAIFAGRGALGQAGKMSGVWPRQTWLVLAALSPLSAAVFINLLALLAFLPSLVKIASGAENDFTRLGFALNGTVVTVAVAVTWLLVDPLYQAAFCVRAFLVESRETGLDLMSALRGCLGTAALLLILANVAIPSAGAEPQARVTARELDLSVERVLEQREYAWRLPRPHDSKPGFIDGAVAPVRAAFRKFARWIGELLDRLFRNNEPGGSAGKPAPFPAARWTLIALLALLAAALSVTLVRLTRKRGDGLAATPAQGPRVIRLNDERISAADLPEEEWIVLGRECLARGDYRLALRAFYLANLAWLGQRELLTIAPWKSNRDYWRELRRRGGGDALQQSFSENVRQFERAWYGLYAVDAEQVDAFEQTFSRMRGYVKT